MEARLNRGKLNRELVVVVAALLIMCAAIAAGYGIRAATSSSPGHTVYVASGGTAQAPQSDAPCLWLGTHKGC